MTARQAGPTGTAVWAKAAELRELLRKAEAQTNSGHAEAAAQTGGAIAVAALELSKLCTARAEAARTEAKT